MTDRIVALVDMDCFYVQVEERLDPSLRGRPCAVVQYNAWKGGGIIAVNYEARDQGVPRHIRGDEAKKLCPEIVLVRVPEVNGKADLTKYRNAGSEVIKTISKFGKCVERASVDEAYIDLTAEVCALMTTEQRVTADQLPSTYVVGADDADRGRSVQEWLNSLEEGSDDMRLAFGATVVEKMRAAILLETGFKCSAGIAHNKVLSKLSCGLHKPNQQTILPHESVDGLFSTMKVKKIRNLGGKFGDEVIEKLKCETMGDVAKFSLKDLKKHFDEKSGLWLYEMARGRDHEPVQSRQLPQSIGCSKNFPGKLALATKDAVKLWLDKLAVEIELRLATDREKNNRIAKVLSIHANGLSRSFGMTSYAASRIAASAFAALDKLNTAPPKTNQWSPALYNLGMSAGKFQVYDNASTVCLQNFFSKVDPKLHTSTNCVSDDRSESPITGLELGDKNQNPRMVGERTNPDLSEIDSGAIVDDNSISENEGPSRSDTSCTGATKETSSDTNTRSAKMGFFASRSKKTPSALHFATNVNSNQRDVNRRKSITELTGIRWEGLPKTTDNDSGVVFECDEIDPEVFANLPSDIQMEIRSQLSANNFRKNGTKLSSDSNLGISKHFISTKIKTEVKSTTDETLPSSSYDSNITSENAVSNFSLEQIKLDQLDRVNDGASTSGQNEISDINVVKAVNRENSNSCNGSPNLFDEGSCSGLKQQNFPSEDRVLCAKCDKYILAWDLPEHNDFHMALALEEADRTLTRSLQRDNINLEGTSSKTTQSEASGGHNGHKRRGRPPKKNVVAAPAKRIRSISTFFVKET